MPHRSLVSLLFLELFLKLFSILFDLFLDYVIVMPTHKQKPMIGIAHITPTQGSVHLAVVRIFHATPGTFGIKSLTGGAAGAACGAPIPISGAGGIDFCIRTKT